MVDGLVLLVLLAGSRLAFRLIRELLARPAAADERRRVLIYGAGDGGELLLREILNNRALHFRPVGFAVDDPMKKGKAIHGLRVLGGNGSFLSICRQSGVDEVLISSARFSDDRVEELARDCESANVRLKRMRLQIETVVDSRDESGPGSRLANEVELQGPGNL